MPRLPKASTHADSAPALGFDNGSMSSHPSGDCPARPRFARRNSTKWEPIGGAVAPATASSKPKAKPQRDIRRALIEADLVDTALRDSASHQREALLQVVSATKNNMVALPGQLFYSTQIPVCLSFLAKNKAADTKRGLRDRRKQTLFIDARKLDTIIERFRATFQTLWANLSQRSASNVA